MAVSDGVFDEGTFDNATFNNITRGETVSVNDTASSEADLFRDLTESVGVDEGSVEVEHGYFQTPSSNTAVTEDLGVEADVVEFRVTSTNPTLDTGQQVQGGDFGWGHGYVAFQDNGIDEYALSHGSGSASTNGHFSESTSSYSVFQAITDAPGDNLLGKIRGSVTQRDGTSIDISFDETQEQQYVFYTAYSFEYADLEVGFFEAENTNTTQSITSPGFQPNFLRLVTTPNLESMDSTVNELGTGQADLGWGQGVAVENSAAVKQGSLAVSQWSSNIDGHAYTSSDSDVLSIAYMTSKQTLNGETKASVSFTSNGFDLTYNKTTNPNNETPVVLYLAANTLSEPDAGFETTPTSTGEQEYSTDVGLGNLLFVGSNTVPFFDDGSGVARRTWGWNYGTTDFSSEEAIGFSSNSDSVNGHYWENETDFAYDQLYTDNNGDLIGRDRATAVARDGDSFTLDWTQITTTADNSNYVINDSVAFFWYGFSRTSQVGGEQITALDKSLNETLGLKGAVTDVGDFFRGLEETVTLNDSQSSESQLFRGLSENFVLSDNEELFLKRNVSDTFTLNDSQSSEAQLFRAVSENITLSDSNEVFIGRKVSESLGLNSSVATDAQLFRAFSANVSLNDSDIKQVERILTENATVSDNSSEQAQLFRNFAEQLDINDNEAKQLFKKLQESFSLSDVEAVLFSKSLTESFSLDDKQVSTDGEFFRTLTENFSLNESESAAFFKNLGENLTVSDSFSKALLRSLSESLVLSDVFSRQGDFFRNINDSFSLNDSLNDEKAVFVALTEGLVLNDSQVSEADLFRTLTDSLTASDNFNREVEFSRSISQNISLNDSEAKKLFKKVSQSVSLNDEDVAFLLQVSFSESFSLTDNVSKTVEFFRSLSESLNLSDSDIKQVSKELGETVSLSENAGREVDLERRFAEDITLQDSPRKALFKSLVETFDVADSKSFSLSRSLTDSFSLSDETFKTLARSLSEEVSINDASELLAIIKVSETVDADDSVETTANLFRDLNENLDLSDSDIKQLARTLEEGVNVNDNVETEAELFRQLSESIVLNDETEVEIFKALAEAVSLSDNVESESELFRNVSETLTLNEVLVKEFSKVLTEDVSLIDETSKKAFKQFSESLDFDDVLTAFKPASAFASEVEIEKLQKAVTNITATRKAVVDLEKD